MNQGAIDALRGGNGEVDGTDERGRVPHGGTDDPWVADFSANTNPRTPDGVAGVYEAALARARSYPADDYSEYRAAAAAVHDCAPRQVVPTAGGLQAIRLAVAVTVTDGDSALLPAPSFGEYAREVRLQGGEAAFVPAEEILLADPADHALAVLCTPNNPTGALPDRADLLAFAERCRAADTPLLVDEAFLGFTEQDSLAGREGVIVARSLTKLYGLPGLRAGYAVATGELLKRLETARRSWTVGTPAAAVGAHCLADREFVAETREWVERERACLGHRLSERYDVRESHANFLLVDVGDPAAVETVCRSARDAGMAIRDATTFRGLDSHVRVAVRERAENERLVDVLVG